MLPSPPTPLPRPNARTWPAGKPLHRVHDGRFEGHQFNPCKGGLTRFAPITDRHGACVPSLYAGSSLEAAIFETIFHDVPVSPAPKSVPRFEVERRTHSRIAVGRELRLADLRTPDLHRWEVERGDLIGSGPSSYPRTALWAQALHQAWDEFDGMIWTSNRCDPDDALLLFGDRVREAEIEILKARAGDDDAFLADVLQAGARAGISLTV